MAIERLRLLDTGETGYRGGGTINCDARATADHPWEVRVRLCLAEVNEFDRWRQDGTPLVVDIGVARTGTATVGRVVAGSTKARAVLEGQGLCPYPEHGAAAPASQESTSGKRPAGPFVSRR